MLDVILERETPHGLLVAIAAAPGPALFDALPEEERAIAATFGERRRATSASGRAALHHALTRLGVDASAAILRDDRGAPLLRRGVLGSISHKETIACALVAFYERAVHIGVDVEALGAVKSLHASLILTDDERARLTSPRDLALALSLKESLYKALDPFVRRYVGFKEVEVFVREDGTAEFRLDLEEGPYDAEGAWLVERGHVITTARVRSV